MQVEVIKSERESESLKFVLVSHFYQTLKYFGGDRKQTSADLKISVDTCYRYIKQNGIVINKPFVSWPDIERLRIM
jgi:hypothetical protein